jgi:hypothetical protein
MLHGLAGGDIIEIRLLQRIEHEPSAEEDREEFMYGAMEVQL